MKSILLILLLAGQWEGGNGERTYLRTGRYECDEVITTPQNLQGDGPRRTEIRKTAFKYHGTENFESSSVEGRVVGPLLVRDVAFVNCTFDFKFCSECVFDNCRFWGCTIEGFSWWDNRFTGCRFVKSTITLQDAVKGVGGNRGFSNALWLDNCTFESIDADFLTLGDRSRRCKILGCKFDRIDGACIVYRGDAKQSGGHKVNDCTFINCPKPERIDK